MRFAFSAIVLAVLALSGGVSASAAQVGERVAAVVNDDPISTFDVRQRMRLMMVTRGITQVPPDALPQFQAQALQELIDERLKVQEAQRWELEIPEEVLDEELERIAAAGGGSLDMLRADLSQHGIDIGTLREKVRADQAWEQLVRGRYGQRVNVTEDEVEDTMSQMKKDVLQDQFLISEICLPVERPEEREQMYDIGMQMIEQMRRGVPFRALAQQYSACPSAARGGDLGWMKETDLDTDMVNVVQRLGVGNVSRPIPQDAMLKMIAVRQVREAAAAGEPAYAVAYAGVPASIGREMAEERLERLAETNACSGNRLSTDVGPDVGITVLPMTPQSSFDTVFHDVLANLEEGATSEIIESEGVFHRVIMCEKDEGFGLPTRSAITNQLEAAELELLSRRYLRDVERDSAVDIRLTSTPSAVPPTQGADAQPATPEGTDPGSGS